MLIALIFVILTAVLSFGTWELLVRNQYWVEDHLPFLVGVGAGTIKFLSFVVGLTIAMMFVIIVS